MSLQSERVIQSSEAETKHGLIQEISRKLLRKKGVLALTLVCAFAMGTLLPFIIAYPYSATARIQINASEAIGRVNYGASFLRGMEDSFNEADIVAEVVGSLQNRAVIREFVESHSEHLNTHLTMNEMLRYFERITVDEVPVLIGGGSTTSFQVSFPAWDEHGGTVLKEYVLFASGKADSRFRDLIVNQITLEENGLLAEMEGREARARFLVRERIYLTREALAIAKATGIKSFKGNFKVDFQQGVSEIDKDLLYLRGAEALTQELLAYNKRLENPNVVADLGALIQTKNEFRLLKKLFATPFMLISMESVLCLGNRELSSLVALGGFFAVLSLLVTGYVIVFSRHVGRE